MSRPDVGSMVVIVALGGALLLTGCASAPPVKEEAMTKTLAPMPEPQRAVGYKVTRIRDGKEDIATLVAQTTDTQTWTDSTGCRYVLLRTGFAPVREFSGCEGNTGTQKVTLLRGTPYPLTAGSKWAYSYAGENARGNKWTGQRDCAVQGVTRVKVSSGEHETYKVVCEDSQENFKSTHTYYISPALQTTVFQERYRVRYFTGAPPPDRTTWEFVKQD